MNKKKYRLIDTILGIGFVISLIGTVVVEILYQNHILDASILFRCFGGAFIYVGFLAFYTNKKFYNISMPMIFSLSGIGAIYASYHMNIMNSEKGFTFIEILLVLFGVLIFGLVFIEKNVLIPLYQKKHCTLIVNAIFKGWEKIIVKRKVIVYVHLEINYNGEVINNIIDMGDISEDKIKTLKINDIITVKIDPNDPHEIMTNIYEE